ncbi:hypothetical protein Tco_0132140 [Tanacetum coccineum]
MIIILTTNTPYPSRKIRRICDCTHQKTTKESRSIRRIQRRPIRRIGDIVCEYSGRYQTCSLQKKPPVRRIQYIGYARRKGAEEVLQRIPIHRRSSQAYRRYFLRIVDPIDLPNVNHDKLRVVVFSISLVGGARRWFDKIKESIDSWVDLTAKFFGKYYPPSHTGKTNTQMIRRDPTNPKFENWLALKFVNYKTVDIFTKGALWDYWKMGSDEIEPTDDESSDLEEINHDDEQEIGEIFRIETNLFDYETPRCEKFKEFNYLLKIDLDLLTKDIEGFNTYVEYKDDWIYERNKDVPWVHEKPWTDTRVWTEPTPVKHYLGNMLRYQDLEWYDALKDSELKEEALRNKATMEGLIDKDVESSNNG